MLEPILLAVARLFGITVGAYFLFSIRPLRERLLKPIVFLSLNVFLPLYFIHNFPTRWPEAMSAGPQWMVGSILACAAFFAIQFALARLLFRIHPSFAGAQPREMTVLYTIQNAGYIPLPILTALVPGPVLIYMFFFVLAFNIMFWTIAVNFIGRTGEKGFRVKINGPILGILAGLVVALLGFYGDLPREIRLPIEWAGGLAMDLILVALGGILAGIPREHIRFRREFGLFVLAKMLAYPAVVLGILAIVPFRGLSADLAYAIKLALVLQAAVPPATNTMLATEAYGTAEQVRFAGSGMIFAYLSAAVTLPIFLVLATLLLAPR
jgi:hypothetical protein